MVAEGVIGVGGQVADIRQQDLAFFAERAGNQADVGTSATYLAMVAPVPMLSSSGWAWTSSKRRSEDVAGDTVMAKTLGQDGTMLDDEEDDPTKNPWFKTAVWIVLALAVVGLILTLVLS